MAAGVISFGRIAVATAGTPVRVTATATPIKAIVFSSYGTGTAVRMYAGTSGLNKTTGANVLGEVYSASGDPDRLTIGDAGRATGNPLDASDYWIDAGADGGSLYVYGIAN